MEPLVQQIVVSLAVAVLTSSGLWALVSKRAAMHYQMETEL